jgi:hypothetical protein
MSHSAQARPAHAVTAHAPLSRRRSSPKTHGPPCMWRAQHDGRASGAGEAMPPPTQACAARAAWATTAPRQTRFLRHRGRYAVQQRARCAVRRGSRVRRAVGVTASRRAGFWRLLRSRRGGRTCCGRRGAATGPATRPTALCARTVAPHAAGAAVRMVVVAKGGPAGTRRASCGAQPLPPGLEAYDVRSERKAVAKWRASRS